MDDEFTNMELHLAGIDASLEPQTRFEMWKETCEKIRDRAIAKIQMEFVRMKNQMLQQVPDVSLVQVTLVNAEMSLPHFEAADELADLITKEDILHSIEEMRAVVERQIEIQKRICDAQIGMALVMLQEKPCEEVT